MSEWWEVAKPSKVIYLKTSVRSEVAIGCCLCFCLEAKTELSGRLEIQLYQSFNHKLRFFTTSFAENNNTDSRHIFVTIIHYLMNNAMSMSP